MSDLVELAQEVMYNRRVIERLTELAKELEHRSIQLDTVLDYTPGRSELEKNLLDEMTGRIWRILEVEGE